MERKRQTKKVGPEELLSRFRSKEDLYRYMVHQGKCRRSSHPSSIVNVFLPSMQGTKLSFLRDILADKKMHLKQNEVIRMEIPAYQELSVKNLYADAMKDEVLQMYLPNQEQMSGRLPEKDFFYGVLCTLRKQYMSDIIDAANQKRFKVDQGDESKAGILISDSWMQELTKHPYYSSKC